MSAPQRITDEDGSQVDVFPLPADEASLTALLRDLFEAHWRDITFGPIIQGAAWEIRASSAPTYFGALDGYLTGQSEWLVNYAERHRAGLRVGTAITEGTANFLVNRRMNKSQQMRWSRRGADLLLQVRCAVYNGTLGSGFGQRFQPANDPLPQAAVAA